MGWLPRERADKGRRYSTTPLVCRLGEQLGDLARHREVAAPTSPPAAPPRSVPPARQAPQPAPRGLAARPDCGPPSACPAAPRSGLQGTRSEDRGIPLSAPPTPSGETLPRTPAASDRS